MNRFVKSLPALALLFLTGCLQVKDELTLQADGSGTIRLEVKAGGSGASRFGAMSDGALIYPPTSDAEARKFFPAKDFVVEVKEETADGGNTVLRVTATFKDVNALLKSPYGHAHALSLKIENNVLTFKALTGFEAVARAAELKDDTGGMAAMAAMAGMEEGDAKKLEMRDEFRITLPNAVSAGNGTREQKTSTWIAEHSKATNSGEFVGLVGKVLEASCPADGLKMSPVTPPHLALGAFSDLQAGVVAATGAAPDTNKIAAAARFVPYALHLTRTLDLSGEGGGSDNSAQLTGVVVLPTELAPQKWGEVKLEEVLDPKGNSLKPREREGGFGYSRSSFISAGSPDEDEEKPEAKDAKEEKHPVTLSFLPPDWKTREIARVKGSVSLQYFGGFQVVKLSNSIPANWITAPDKNGSTSYNMSSGEKIISDPALTPLGLSMELQMGMVQSGMTMLMFQFKGTKADVAEVQVFDADGKAWPTIMQNRGGMGMMSDSGESMQVYVTGRPKAPLSLALLLSSAGTTVEVPILLEHVPVAGK